MAFPRLSFRPSTFCHVYKSAHYSHFTSFFTSPLLRKWHTTFPLLPSILHSNITHLQNALQQISSWMTANHLLILNSSKTEFLLIALKQQLYKIHDTRLTTTYSARNLGFILTITLPFSDRITSFFQSVHRWSIVVSTICRHSSRVMAFLQAVVRPKFRGPRSTSIARSQVWLGLPAGHFQSGGTCRIHAARARWWSSRGELRAI